MKLKYIAACTTIGMLLAITPVASFAGNPFSDAVRVKENMEPAIPHPAQDLAAQKKLADLKAKTGKKPNIVLIIADDLGFGDPGAYGGGEAIGAATPNIDRLAHEGLRLTSAYSQPTCTPTRSAIITGRLPVRTGLFVPF